MNIATKGKKIKYSWKINEQLNTFLLFNSYGNLQLSFNFFKLIFQCSHKSFVIFMYTFECLILPPVIIPYGLDVRNVRKIFKEMSVTADFHNY
jgi:hypothetical protein